MIDAAQRKQIRVALDHLRRRDLYDVLGLGRDAPSSEIVRMADAERQVWMRKSQVTAEKTAWLEAISYAQSHLSAPASRARYDRTLALESEERFASAIEFSIQGTTSLAPGTRAYLRDEAAALGILPDRADRLIDRSCRSRGIARTGPSPNGSASVVPGRQLRCRSCGGLTAFEEASRTAASSLCRHCGASLRWNCPVCQRARWADESRCACGFPQEWAEPLVRHFEAAQHAHKVRDFAGALEHLRRVQEFAPKHVGARKAIEKVKERLAEIDAARSAFETEKARKHLVAARAALGAWGRLVDPTEPDLKAAQAQVVSGLREALFLAAKAKALASADPKAAVTIYRQSLAIAADLAEAREGLRLCPPEAPANLKAEVAEDRVRLRWSAPPDDGLGPPLYRVVRNRGNVPNGPTDGAVLGEVAAPEFEDATVTPGDAVGYAVFATQGGVASLRGAAFGPMTVLADVREARAEAQSGEVVLSWIVPTGALDVKVIRKVGSPPTGPDDGDPVPSLRTGAVDRGLKDDQVYHYGIYARYRTSEGRIAASRGALVSALPTTPVATILEPSLGREADGRVRISWSRPEKGQVKILRTPRPLPLVPGDRILSGKLDASEGLWLPRSAPDHAFDAHPPEMGVCHYSAFIAWAGGLTVGRSVAFSNVPDPSDLRAVRSAKDGRVKLRWRWSPQGGRSLLVAKAGSFPTGPDDPLARKEFVEEGDYSRDGWHALTLPASDSGPWHIAVFSVAEVAGQSVVSPGIDATSRTVVPGPNAEVVVSYRLIPPKLLGRDWAIAFQTRPAGAVIPATVLVTHARTVPLSADDGEVVARFPTSRDGARFSIRPTSPALHRGRARIFADPMADPGSLSALRIRHPEADGTRV